MKNEAEFSVAVIGELIALEMGNVLTVEQITATRRAVEAAEYVHQRRFPGAARAHKRDEFTGLNLQRYTAHGMHFHFAGAINFVHAIELNHEAVALVAFRHACFAPPN